MRVRCACAVVGHGEWLGCSCACCAQFGCMGKFQRRHDCLSRVCWPGKLVMRLGSADLLRANLGVVQGHVSPLCAGVDTALKVSVALDSRIMADPSTPVLFHPFANTASVALSPPDLVKFLHSTGHKVHVVDFDKESVQVL